MQDSLGGNSKTLMLVMVPPTPSSVEETLISLHYAARARMITNRSVKGEKGEVERLRREVASLRRERVGPRPA